jgi:hypothetical protein
VGTDRKPTQIPDKVDALLTEPRENYIILAWQGPPERDFLDDVSGGIGSLAGNELNNFIYEGVYDPRGYEIFRKIDGDARAEWREIAVVLVEQTRNSGGLFDIIIGEDNRDEYTFTDRNVSQGITYIYAIAAYNGAGPSEKRMSLPTRTLFGGRIANFSAARGANNTVELSWNAAENCTYVVQRGIAKHSFGFQGITSVIEWNTISPANFSETSFIDNISGVGSDDGIVHYRVYLVHNEYGRGSYSQERSVSIW